MTTDYKCEETWELTDPWQYGVAAEEEEEEEDDGKEEGEDDEQKKSTKFSFRHKYRQSVKTNQTIQSAISEKQKASEAEKRPVGRPGSYKTAFFERAIAEKIEQFVPHNPSTSISRLEDICEFLVHTKQVVRKLKIQQLYRSRDLEPVDEWKKPEELLDFL